MDFVPTVDYPDVYCRLLKKPNGEYWYELLLVYVDYVICCFNNPQLVIDTLALVYDLKDKSVRQPKIYLGDEVNKYQVRCCTMALNMWSYTDCINLHAKGG